MKNKLYDTVKTGDLRTVVAHLNKGEQIITTDGMIVIKANVKLKAIEEFRGRDWVLKRYDLTSMVEVEEARDDRPPPTEMPIPRDNFDGDIPEARVVSLWERVFGSRW